jgi:hypothetical protein
MAKVTADERVRQRVLPRLYFLSSLSLTTQFLSKFLLLNLVNNVDLFLGNSSGKYFLLSAKDKSDSSTISIEPRILQRCTSIPAIQFNRARKKNIFRRANLFSLKTTNSLCTSVCFFSHRQYWWLPWPWHRKLTRVQKSSSLDVEHPSIRDQTKASGWIDNISSYFRPLRFRACKITYSKKTNISDRSEELQLYAESDDKFVHTRTRTITPEKDLLQRWLRWKCFVFDAILSFKDYLCKSKH